MTFETENTPFYILNFLEVTYNSLALKTGMTYCISIDIHVHQGILYSDAILALLGLDLGGPRIILGRHFMISLTQRYYYDQALA
jgi:hypothetical protein